MRRHTATPSPLPLENLPWGDIAPLLGPAHRVLAQCDAVFRSQRLFPTLALREAKASFASSDISPLLAIGTIPRTTPLARPLLCHIHNLICHRSATFRTQQNWIGPEGHSIREAYFLPPRPQYVPMYMQRLTQYLSYKEKDPLVQLAIYFAQLLIIHPFMDGNGRLARAVIPFFLYKKGLISAPHFYLSSYFKRHRLHYFEKLFSITTKDKWTDWIQFFLKGIIDEGTYLLKQYGP